MATMSDRPVSKPANAAFTRRPGCCGDECGPPAWAQSARPGVRAECVEPRRAPIYGCADSGTDRRERLRLLCRGLQRPAVDVGGAELEPESDVEPVGCLAARA